MIIDSARYPSDFVGFRAELLIKGLVIAIDPTPTTSPGCAA
jgi:hypothetical protein